jgi:UDP-N-acetylglucosamine kinase
MDETEKQLEAEAFEYIKKNRKALIEKFAPPDICRPVANPISLFMAGSPGAGKTEVSIGLVKQFKDMPIRIDADEIRKICKGYAGLNAHVFQKAANKGVNMLFDYSLNKKINLILDCYIGSSYTEHSLEKLLL